MTGVQTCALPISIPHFVDSEEKTLGIDSKKLEKYLDKITEQKNGLCINRKTLRIIRACVPTHIFGHPIDLNGLIKVTNKFNIELIEDAAESLGSFYHKTHTGTFGKIGILSFNGNKILTTGGGGAILTNDKIIADRAKHLLLLPKKIMNGNFSMKKLVTIIVCQISMLH